MKNYNFLENRCNHCSLVPTSADFARATTFAPCRRTLKKPFAGIGGRQARVSDPDLQFFRPCLGIRIRIQNPDAII